VKVDKQGKFDCVLATIAAIADKSLVDVTEVALKIFEVDTWEDTFVFSGIGWWQNIYKIAIHFNITCIPKAGHENIRVLSSGNVLLHGRGAITINSIGILQHTMPFEDGVIYDPLYPNNPIPIEKLCIRYGNEWKIIDISYQKEKNVK